MNTSYANHIVTGSQETSVVRTNKISPVKLPDSSYRVIRDVGDLLGDSKGDSGGSGGDNPSTPNEHDHGDLLELLDKDNNRIYDSNGFELLVKE